MFCGVNCGAVRRPVTAPTINISKLVLSSQTNIFCVVRILRCERCPPEETLLLICERCPPEDALLLIRQTNFVTLLACLGQIYEFCHIQVMTFARLQGVIHRLDCNKHIVVC